MHALRLQVDMPDDDAFWDFYWEVALEPMENLGKREAILSASQLIRRLSSQYSHPLRVLELGCGEGQIVGTLMNSHAQLCDSKKVVGVDYKAQSLARCRSDYPGFQFVEGDFTDPVLLSSLGKYDIVLLVNALHEVFSAEVSPDLGEVDVPAAKRRVEAALTEIVRCLEPGGWVVLFDGLEPPGGPADQLLIRFCDAQAWKDFEVFAAQYQPFRISYRDVENDLCVELSRRDFTRYITKSIFLGKPLWLSERFESYQYFNEDEFRTVFARQNLEIKSLRTLTMNLEKWRRVVEMITPGEDFPQEHILIQARKKDD
jgi:SAM-dependent methyltransferase